MKYYKNLILNGFLFIAFLLILLAPPFFSTFLLPSNSSGEVAGWTSRPLLRVVPNEQDFDDLVDFVLDYSRPDQVKATVKLTAFSQHLAIYHRLFVLENTSSRELELKILLAQPPKERGFEAGGLVLFSPDSDYFARLEKSAARGETLLKVEQPQLFQLAKNILLEEEVIKLLMVTPSGLITSPLQQSHPAGSLVYPQPIYFTSQQVKNWATRSLRLAPGEKAIVTGFIKGTSRLPSTKLELKLLFQLPNNF